MTDEHYIKKAIRLARKGMGYVSPNPMVGSVIVNNGAIVGQGYHHCFGGPHAEVNALKEAGERARGATLYVNLEPCCHYGKTPPCTDAIIQAGIKRVVIGMIDPNPLVNQRGIQILQAHGIEVRSGIEAAASQELNRVFIKYITTGMPYVTLKIAQSLDGRIATRTGHSKWITSNQAQIEAHRIRSQNDAIVVGIGTVLADNPQLTVRHVKGRNPMRVVLDSQLRIPMDCHLLSDGLVEKTIIVTTSSDRDKIDRVTATGAQVWRMDRNDSDKISIPLLLKRMAQARLSAVMVEGGAQVNTSFLQAKMVDRIIFAMAPKIIGAGIEAIGDLGIRKVDECLQLINMKTKKSGPDLLVTAEVRYDADPAPAPIQVQ